MSKLTRLSWFDSMVLQPVASLTSEATRCRFVHDTVCPKEAGSGDVDFQSNDSPSGIGCGLWAALLGAGLVGGCASLEPPPPIATDSNVRRSQQQSLDMGVDPYFAFNRALSEAQQSGAGADKQAALLNEGFALVSYRCTTYFASLGKAEQNFRFARKETTLASGLVLGMLGLTNATPKAIANTGALLAFGTASMDSYEDVYIYSPDVRNVQRLVTDALASYRTKVADSTDSSQLTYTAVVDILAAYEAYCQPQGIREMVNQSVTQSKTVGDAAGASAPPPATPPAPSPVAPGAPMALPVPSPALAPGVARLKVVPQVSVRVVPR